MSHKITNAVRLMRLPPTAKHVLRVLADIADDSGNCYPSIQHLMNETCLSNRAVCDAVATLEQSGVLQCSRANGRRTVYQITPEGFVEGAAHAPKKAQKPVSEVHQCGKFTSEPAAKSSEPAAGVPVNLPQKAVSQVHTTHQYTSNNTSGNHQYAREQPRPEPAPTPRAKKSEPVHQLPDWVNPESWAGFVDMRKAIKKPLTDRAMQLAIGKLGKLRQQGQDPNACLDQSVMNGWQDVYAIKPDHTAKKQAQAGKWDFLSQSQEPERDVTPFRHDTKATEPPALSWIGGHGHA